MTATIIDGKKVSQEVREELKPRVQNLIKQGLKPGLAVVLVGDDPASQVYVRNKEKACEKLGIYSLKHQMPASTNQTDLLQIVDQLNNDPAIHGILVQLPLPKHLNEKTILYHINPLKDVDGFHPYNLGRLMIGDPIFLPCTPWGVQELLSRYQIDVAGKNVVIVGRSNIVGKPLAMMLVQKAKAANATVTICHTGTNNLAQHTLMADVLIAAAGSPKMITGDMVREGAVVIDVGVNKVDDHLVGDVDFESVVNQASFITPVPGGVGPMTIAMLMANTVKSAERTLQSNLVS
jgi:methylenetetrahydrofolate dehydrogenase (NADP+)/methenyltetrahydrofolate cyclohydrolase